MPSRDTRERLEALFEGPLTTLGFDLEAMELTHAGKHSVLRVAVDQDGGISMDDIAEATRTLSALLDKTDLMGEGAYTLEVSSPGVDRPLTLPRHWRRNRNRLVKVDLAGASIMGRVVSNTEDSVVLSIDSKMGVSRQTIAFSDIHRAKVDIEFTAFPGFDEESEE